MFKPLSPISIHQAEKCLEVRYCSLIYLSWGDRDRLQGRCREMLDPRYAQWHMLIENIV